MLCVVMMFHSRMEEGEGEGEGEMRMRVFCRVVCVWCILVSAC